MMWSLQLRRVQITIYFKKIAMKIITNLHDSATKKLIFTVEIEETDSITVDERPLTASDNNQYQILDRTWEKPRHVNTTETVIITDYTDFVTDVNNLEGCAINYLIAAHRFIIT